MIKHNIHIYTGVFVNVKERKKYVYVYVYIHILFIKPCAYTQRNFSSW